MIGDAALGSRWLEAGLLSLLMLPACGSAPQSKDYPPEVRSLADQVLAQAKAEEPQTTFLIEGAATAIGGEMEGLEHRLKTRESTLDKIHRLMLEKPDVPANEIVVYDALRYTVIVPDQPPGHHGAGLASLLQELEASGHQVKTVKNYWPKGDSYSGINAVIISPSGLNWELQIHTPTSFAVKTGTHRDYERMRDDTTPLSERQALFEKQAEVWEDVRVPEGILEPKSLHENEVLRELRPPQ